MLYLLGGVPRCGKSIIAQKVQCESKIPYFSLDFLMMGLVNGVPQFDIDPNAPIDIIGRRLWPLVNAMCINIIEVGVDYLIEGAQLLPKFVNELLLLYPSKVRACFIGYADISPNQKLNDIRNYHGLPNDWINNYPDKEILNLITMLINESKIQQAECERFKIPYFDSSNGFNGTIKLVCNYFNKG